MLFNETSARTRLIIPQAAIEPLHNAHILVVGLGGVGAYAAEMLARVGIGNFTLIDHDIVNPSNINRQLLALNSTIGLSKAELMRRRILDINPNAHIDCRQEFLRDESLIKICEQPFDYIVDAIDTLSPKVFLLYYALKNQQRIISSMGAGGKFDPLQIRVSDISETYNCRLAYVIRKRLRKMGVASGFPAVFSTEQIDKSRLLPSEESNKKSTIGTISYLPAAFGLHCAAYVIQKIIVGCASEA